MAPVKKAASEPYAFTVETSLASEEYVPRIMPQILGTWDMTTTFVVSIYLASSATTAAAAGPAAITYLLLVCLTFFVPCLIATAQLGYMYPFEGALYNWTHKAIGGFWSFFAGFCAWFPGVLISTSLAELFVTYLRDLNNTWLVSPWQQGLAICAILLFAGLFSTWRFRYIQNIINVLVCLMFVGSLLIALSGILWLINGHASAIDFSNWNNWQVKPDNYVMFGLMAFAYIGTEGPLNLAGEIKGRHVIKRHLLWGALIILVTYLTNTASILIVQGQKAALSPFSMVTTVNIVLGKGLGYVTAGCLMGSFIATVLVYNYLYARLLLVGSIDHRLPEAASKLNKYRTPANAILFQTALALVFTLLTFALAPLVDFYGPSREFSTRMYSICQAAASLVWTISTTFLFIDLLGCYIRNRHLFYYKRIFPMPILWTCMIVGPISCLFTIVDTLFFSWTTTIDNHQWWYLVGSLTLIFLIISAICSMVARSEAEWQQFREITLDLQKDDVDAASKEFYMNK